MARPWVKLWTKTLLNPEIAELPDYLFRRWIEVLMLAGMYESDGLLPPVRKMAFILRLPEVKLSENLTALSQVGVVHQDDAGNWIITNWKKHQYSESTNRVREYRERQKEGEKETSDNRYSNGYSNGDNSVTHISSTSDSSLIFKLYESEIGSLTPKISEELKAACEDYPAEWFEPAFSEAARHNKRNWAYVRAILKNWKANGFQSKKGKSNGAGPTIEELYPVFTAGEAKDGT